MKNLHEMHSDDEFFVSLDGLRVLTIIPIRKIKIGTVLPHGLKLIRKVCRERWWEFWKPKYIGAILKKINYGEFGYAERW